MKKIAKVFIGLTICMLFSGCLKGEKQPETVEDTELLSVLCERVECLYEAEVENASLLEEDVCYYDGVLTIRAEGLWNSDTPELHNRQISLLCSESGKADRRLLVGEIAAAQTFQELYAGVGKNGQMAVITQSDSRIHEIFVSMDAGMSWKRAGTAESFAACYNRLVSCISFADEQKGVVGCPFVDPVYSIFLYTENGGATWQQADLERLADGEEYCYSALQVCLEQDYGAAVVKITTNGEAPEKDGVYLYVSEDGGRSWRVDSILAVEGEREHLS